MNYFSNSHSNNISHIFHTEVLPLVKINFDKMKKSHLYIIKDNIDLANNGQKWRHYILSGIFPEVNYILEKNICRLEKPRRVPRKVALDPHMFNDYRPNASYINLIDSLKCNLNISESQDSYVLLNQRNVANRYLIDLGSKLPLEEYLTVKLAELNIPFKWCNFSTIPPEKQIELCNGANIFISAHGAGLTNLAFTPNHCLVIEYNFRKHWHCNPVCDDHYSGKLPYDEQCDAKLTFRPYFHKADYHNFSRVLGKRYFELEVEQYKGYLDRNPISRKQLIVDGNNLVKLIQKEFSTKSRLPLSGLSSSLCDDKSKDNTPRSPNPLNKYVAQSPGYILETLSKETGVLKKYLISHPESGKTYPINEAAAMIWKCCENTIQVSELIKLFTEAYPQNTSITSDIYKLLDQLQKKDLVYIFMAKGEADCPPN